MLKLTIRMGFSENLPEFCYYCDTELKVSQGAHEHEQTCDECNNVYTQDEQGLWSIYSPYPERDRRSLPPRLKSPVPRRTEETPE